MVPKQNIGLGGKTALKYGHNSSVERVMQDYEIRIINRDGALSLVAVDRHVSDFTAIRAALHLCKEGDKAEVWRGDECVYADTPRRKSA